MQTRFTHCALHVQDMRKSVEFYREFCGLEVVREHGHGPNDHATWMAEPGRATEFVFVLLLGGAGHEQAAGDLSHFGFALDTQAQVDEIAERGRDAGCLAWEPKSFPYPVGRRCALRDPDGFIVEFSYGQPLGPGAAS
jgi:catechol 2,3-dioxygenase-like lactoylglutathione lyase family enzyme